MNELELERRLCVVEDRSKSNSHRLRAVEEKQDAMTDLVQSVAAMAQKQVDMDADLTEIKADVKNINLKPAKRWYNVIDKALLGDTGAISKVQNGDYNLSKVFSEEDMNSLIQEIVTIINNNVRTVETKVPADKAIEYATPDTMTADIRNYIEGYYYRAAIKEITPDDAGTVTLQIITVSTKTDASIALLLTLCMDKYTYNEDTKFEDLAKAMWADEELQALLSGINDTVKGAYGDVYTQLYSSFLKSFGSKALAKAKVPTIQKATLEVVDGETTI